jgi:hypothetical protein
VAADRLVELVEDRARGEKALRCAEDLLHHRQLLIAKHDFKRREVRVGAQHEDAIEPGVLLGLGTIDDEAILTSGRQEAVIAAIVAFLQLPFQRGKNRGAVGGVLLGLFVIAASNRTGRGTASDSRSKTSGLRTRETTTKGSQLQGAISPQLT